MKYLLLVFSCLISVFVVKAQKSSCNCTTKQGNYSLTIEGTVIYKGTSKAKGHTYDVNLSFKNESSCGLKVESILMGSTLINPAVSLNTDSKSRKKSFKKLIQLNTLLEPSVGLDDALFADLLVSYTLNGKPCSHDVTVAYKK
ncbi:hypothetical protein [Runella limosa]|jgi:hypothetical protein|uniref:hypothetical protein n=1 Tax=Runella limosa TaxID=370978 RepID=UPI00048AC3B0|nr:hypothetical protein [Runella limosa]